MLDLMDLHTHTIASGHAYNTIYEMVNSAAHKGLHLLGITDHGPAMKSAVPQNYFNNFKMLPRELYGIHVMFGCELNILNYDGEIDLPESILAKLDYAVASIHKACYSVGTVSQNTSACVKAMENPYVNILGHPDYMTIPVDYETLVLAAKENDVLLEVNSESLNPRCARVGARQNYYHMLELCKQNGVSIILDSDAHCEIDVGNHHESISILKEIAFPDELVANTSLKQAAKYIPFINNFLTER